MKSYNIKLGYSMERDLISVEGLDNNVTYWVDPDTLVKDNMILFSTDECDERFFVNQTHMSKLYNLIKDYTNYVGDQLDSWDDVHDLKVNLWRL